MQALKRSKMQAGTNQYLSEAQATEEEGRMKRQNRQMMKQELILFHILLQHGSCPVEPCIAVSHYLEHLFMNPKNKG